MLFLAALSRDAIGLIVSGSAIIIISIILAIVNYVCEKKDKQRVAEANEVEFKKLSLKEKFIELKSSLRERFRELRKKEEVLDRYVYSYDSTVPNPIEKDFIATTSTSFGHITVFGPHNKPVHIYHLNDLTDTYTIADISDAATVIAKYRQVEVDGKISGKSNAYLRGDISSGFLCGGGDIHGEGEGKLSGDIKNKVTFILALKYKDRNFEINVSSDIYYDVEINDSVKILVSHYNYGNLLPSLEIDESSWRDVSDVSQFHSEIREHLLADYDAFKNEYHSVYSELIKFKSENPEIVKECENEARKPF